MVTLQKKYMNKKKSTLIAVLTITLFAWTNGMAQEAKIYVIKQGAINFQIPVSNIDSIIFYDPDAIEQEKDPFDREMTGPNATYSNGATAAMTNPFFWLRFAQDKGFDTGTPILTDSEIASFTNTLVAQSNLRLTLPSALVHETTVTYSQLDALATTYGYKSSPKNFASYLPNFSGSRSVQHGIVTRFSQMYSYPVVTTGTTYLETGLEVCEGVVIYGEYGSGANAFYLVKSQNYFGWVLQSTVAICSQEDFRDYFTPSEFVVVTAERLPTYLDGLSTAFRMGTKLPLVSQTGNNVSFRIPIRTETGGLISQEITLPIDRDEYIHIGYLPYTTTNLLKQMFKMLGQPYGWGDRNSDRDCSSTLWTAYKCCGFLLPRNTGQMELIPAGSYCVSVGGNSTIMNALSAYRPGTILLKSGHVVMYLGYYNGAHYIIHNSSSINGCRVTGLSMYDGQLTSLKAIQK